MRKTAFFIAAMATITLIATQAMACYWDGYWGGPMGGPMDGFYNNTYSGGVYQKFFDRTAKDRHNLAGKRNEYRALMADPNANTKRVAELEKEITAMNEQLSAQARSYNLPTPSSGSGSGYGRRGMYSGCW